MKKKVFVNQILQTALLVILLESFDSPHSSPLISRLFSLNKSLSFFFFDENQFPENKNFYQ